jgi:DNA-binding ferritin-like protein
MQPDLASCFAVLVADIRCLAMIHQTFHWIARGPEFFSDHLLFERLYTQTNADVDTIAEKMLGICGDTGLLGDVPGQIGSMQEFADSFYGTHGSIGLALAAENNFITSVNGCLEMTDDPGVKTFLEGLIDKHQGHIYLLSQRLK